MKPLIKIFLLIQLIAFTAKTAQDKVQLTSDGTIPVWLTNGPFEVETIGFGELSDKNSLDELNLRPSAGTKEKNSSVNDGMTRWNYLSTDNLGYTDIKEYYGWKTFNTTEKIWYEKIVYAYATVYSEIDQQAELKFGGNTIIQIRFNNEEIYRSLQTANVQKDNFTRRISLKKGENSLLLKIANSHNNHALSFFVPAGYDWGFYLRLTGLNNDALKSAAVSVNRADEKNTFKIIPTCFYKKIKGSLKQKYLIEITSDKAQPENAEISFKINSKLEKTLFKDIKFGLNMKEFYITEPAKPEKLNASLKLGNETLEGLFTFEALPKYELYFMPTTHMDIGYTNPQPVVIERQLKTLDEVLEKCRTDKNFKWTIETMWLLENFRQSRNKEKFDSLITLIKNGRVAVSPVYSNPFTGWISENEMHESFRWVREYKEKYGISYYGAVYNDVPGQSWALPEALKKTGVKVLVNGINEIFSNYKYQRSLPKVFNWKGSSDDSVTLYLTEAYTEGLRYGLERDTSAIENRIWHSISNLVQRKYPYNKILINAAFTDNSGIAYNQYENAQKWNKSYEYPKFITSTLNDFSREITKENLSKLQTIKGDWTSDWDILNQGETKRFLQYRWVQNNLPSAEILSSFIQLSDKRSSSFAPAINSVYKDLLEFSGHGSGLEYGYGSAFENRLTEEFREGYVQNSYLKTRELLSRSAYRLTAQKESFDSHGIIVFNTLSWDRSIPVEIEFPETDLNNYSVFDLLTKKEISSFRKEDKLYLLAEGVPGLGYRQYELVKSTKSDPRETGDSGYIQNEYYTIKLSENRLSVILKSTGDELLSTGSNIKSFMPLRKRSQLNEEYLPVTEKLTLKATEKNSVYEELSATYQDEIFSEIKFRLWKKLNRVDVSLKVNLNGLRETKYTEEYGLPFAFNKAKSNFLFEGLGGLTSLDDRFPAAGHQYFSIRRVINIPWEDKNIVVASPDCRVFLIDTTGGKNNLIANLLNNFPKSWNRNQDNDGSALFRFSITQLSSKDDITGFGYEVAGDPVVRRSWYKKSEPVDQYIKFSNPHIKLISLRPESDDQFQMILQNSTKDEKQTIKISSGILFNNATVTEVDYMGQKISSIAVKDKSIEVEIFPNSTKKIMVKLNSH